MSIWKKTLLLFLIASLLISPLTLPSGAQTGEISPAKPTVSAESAILIEAESGRVIYEKQSDKPLPMASTTKVMTALVALSLASPETVITVSPLAVGIEGSSIYLTAGEKLTLEELLYALLLESANDAAAAIATGLCGSIEEFANEMNRKAEALGLKSTHFTNPHGLDDEEHYTTAEELAIIAKKALENDLIATIVATGKASIPSPEGARGRLLINHNKLLRLYQGCIGVKTGYTKRSGRCLVSAAERDGVRLIAVTINAPDDWSDHKSLYDYGFPLFEAVTLCQKEDFRIPLALVGGVEAYVLVSNPSDLTVTLPSSHGKISPVIELDRFEFAPVQAGTVQGRVVYLCDTDGDGTEEKIAECPLIAAYDVEKRPQKKGFWQWLLSLFGIR